MRTTRTAGLVLISGALIATACGSDEASLEELLEAETGDDVEIDLDNDGGFSLESEEGSISVDEEGNFVITDEEGQVITGDVDVDGDSIVVESDDGQVVVDSEDGSFEITDEEGNVAITGSEDFPEDWPAAVPQPTGLDIVGSSTFADDVSQGWTVVGTTDMSPVDYLASYGPMLEAAGFSQTTNFESEGNVSAFYEGTEYFVTVAGALETSGANTMTIALASNDG